MASRDAERATLEAAPNVTLGENPWCGVLPTGRGSAANRRGDRKRRGAGDLTTWPPAAWMTYKKSVVALQSVLIDRIAHSAGWDWLGVETWIGHLGDDG